MILFAGIRSETNAELLQTKYKKWWYSYMEYVILHTSINISEYLVSFSHHISCHKA